MPLWKDRGLPDRRMLKKQWNPRKSREAGGGTNIFDVIKPLEPDNFYGVKFEPHAKEKEYVLSEHEEHIFEQEKGQPIDRKKAKAKFCY